MTNKAPVLTAKQKSFLKLYLGRNPELLGNATRCYKAVYGLTNDRSAQVSASKLLNKPHVKLMIEKAEQAALDRIGLNATHVLEESHRLLRRAMGDEAIETVTVKPSDDGKEVIEVSQRYDYDPKTAKAALELIGKHKDIQAFTQTVEHSHTHRLEQRLAQQGKALEHGYSNEPAPVTLEHKPQQENKRGSISPEVKSNQQTEKENPLSDSAGATVD